MKPKAAAPEPPALRGEGRSGSALQRDISINDQLMREQYPGGTGRAGGAGRQGTPNPTLQHLGSQNACNVE